VREEIRYQESFLGQVDYDRNFADWDKSKGYKTMLNNGNIAGVLIARSVTNLTAHPPEFF
jgi:hypothetical protein